MTDNHYHELLNEADIGLALQMPSGIFSQTRTPSKAYEFLASGKLVIAMRVGDLDELYPHSAVCLENEKPAELAALIRDIAHSPETMSGSPTGACVPLANAILIRPLVECYRALFMRTPENSSYPMKLMSIITTLNPAYGGPAECAIQLHKNVVSRGHSYDVVTLDSPDAEWNKRLPFNPIGLGKNGRQNRVFEPELVKFLKQSQSQYDGSILHGIWTTSNVAMRIVWDSRHKYVVFPHGMLDPYFINNFPVKHVKKSLYYRLIAAPLLSNALATLFTCEEERRLANTSYRPVIGRREVVRYGINPPPLDQNTYQGRLLALKDTLAGKDVFLYLGRIHPKKGCDLLIEALSTLAERHPRAHLIMAGPDQTGLGAKLQKLTIEKSSATE